MDHFRYIEPNVLNLWATHTIKTVPEYFDAKKLGDRMPFKFPVDAYGQNFLEGENGQSGVDPIYGMDLNMAAMQLHNPDPLPFLAQMYEETLGIDHFADEPYYDSDGYEK